MHRRSVLSAAGTLLASAGFASNGHETSARSSQQHAATKQVPFPYLETGDRTRLSYKDWGSGERVVVFVHGWPFHSVMWQYQMLHLASEGVRVIAYDQRGCGRSPDPGTGYDFDTLADDLASVIEQLGLRKVVLVGHSIGTGQIVRYLSRHGSDRVSRIVLLSASMPYIQKSADNPDGLDPAIFEQWRMLVRTNVPSWIVSHRQSFAPQASPEMFEWAVRMVEENSLWALVRTNQVEVETDWRRELPKVRVPTLVVHGDVDHTCQIDTTGRRVAQLIPGAELKVYSGAAHGLFMTHAAALNDDLLSFVKT